jgi:hypothetical protein
MIGIAPLPIPERQGGDANRLDESRIGPDFSGGLIPPGKPMIREAERMSQPDRDHAAGWIRASGRLSGMPAWGITQINIGNIF